MDKTMTRFFVILAALTCAAPAQTYRTVTADTNNVIRTNFTLGAAQVSGAFAISNVTGLQSALDGKLATNGNASALTNFPASLLRTNGDGSGLTNLPNANLTNATGVLGLANGGTGQTNAALVIEALLPAYTNNADKVLALNSNATGLVWVTNSGGGGGSGVTTNIIIQTLVPPPPAYAIYTNRSDFTNAIGTNAFFDDDLTNIAVDTYSGSLLRTNTNNSLTYSFSSSGGFLYVESVNSQIWLADGSSGATNLIISTTNTNIKSVGFYVFATDINVALQTNVVFRITVNGTNTNTFTPVNENSFFGIVHTNSITNVTLTTLTNNRYATTRGVLVSEFVPPPGATNTNSLQISNGSIISISNL